MTVVAQHAYLSIVRTHHYDGGRGVCVYDIIDATTVSRESDVTCMLI